MNTLSHLSGAVLLATLTACTTVKETGRMQLMLSDSANEARESALAFQQLKTNRPISTDSEKNAAVRRVGNRLLATIAPRKNLNWEFVVFNDPDPNAFALPGGKVGVNTGLFKLATTDAQLAAVMGHEMTHVTARHGEEGKSQDILASTGGLLIDVGSAVADVPPIVADVAGMGYDAGIKMGVLLPYSRAQEYEADYVGMLYMARAGYDPREAITFWHKMEAWSAKCDEKHGPAFLRTHPLDSARVARLQKHLAKALPEYEKARDTVTR
ncbi:MAG: M48 family metallopeptidase [Chthoniobacterales bacterium]